MAVCDGESRIVIPLKPSLIDMCKAKVAIGLFTEFGLEMLKNVFSEMKSERSIPELGEDTENCSILRNRAKEKLLLIPTNSRREVLKTVEHVQNEVSKWKYDHEYIPGLCDSKFRFFFRADGTIDRTQTAQDIVQNQNIDTRARFDLACMYCLPNSVQTLSKELKARGDTENYEASFNSIENFWVKWMREGTQVPWTEAVREYIEPYWIVHPSAFVPRFSSIFRELMPNDRRKFFNFLYFSDMDDLRFCLYTVTKPEQEEIMKLYVNRVLEMHMQWPLVSIFQETAEKSLEFLDDSSFCAFLEQVLCSQNKPDLDYDQIALEFWKRIPDRTKENFKRNKYLSYLLETIQRRGTKRKVVDDNEESVKRFKK